MEIAFTTTGHPIELDEVARSRHIYIAGKTGQGKSTLLQQIALADIEAHKATVVIDPHGDLAENIIDCIPANRTEDVCYIDLSDTDYAVGFDPLRTRKPGDQATAITEALKDIFSDSWGPRLEWFLWNGLVLIIENGLPLQKLAPIFYSSVLRDRYIRHIKDPISRQFWTGEFPTYDKRLIADAQGPILNKLGAVLKNEEVRRSLNQNHPRFNIRGHLVAGGVVIINLNKGAIGELPARAFGSLIVSQIQNFVMSRGPHRARNPISLVCDEFQLFATGVFESILSEARKYGLQVTAAHQFISQLSDELRAAIFGNVGTLIAFQLSHEDAALIAPEFNAIGRPPFNTTSITELLPYHAYLKHSTVHEIETLPPFEPMKRAQLVKDASRRLFARQL